MFQKSVNNERVPLDTDLELPMVKRFKSRKPAIETAEFLHATNYSPQDVYKEIWTSNGINSYLFAFNQLFIRVKIFRP